MLATITDYWFVTLPTLFTGFFLLRKLQQIREEAAARALIPVAVARNNIANNK